MAPPSLSQMSKWVSLAQTKQVGPPRLAATLDLVAVDHRRFRARSVGVDLPGHEQRYEERNHREHVPSHLFTLSVVDFQRFG